MMKRILAILLIVSSFVACKDEDIAPVLEDLVSEHREDDAIRLEISTDYIELDPLKRREQALLVTWEPLSEMEKLYPVRYLFKIDLTENGFPNSVVSEVVSEGIYFKTFTHEELEDLIKQTWGREDNNEVHISVRVIAQITSEEKFIQPMYSTLDLTVKPYHVESSPLFAYGEAFGTTGENMVALNEYRAGQIYTWRGRLSSGTFKLAQAIGGEYPGYVKGEEDQMVLLEEPDPTAEGFDIPYDANYMILIDRLNQKISIEEVPYLNLYFGGSATPTAWSNPPRVQWDVFRPNICTITVTLQAGECKFSTEPNFSAGTLQLRPRRADGSIFDDLDVMASNNNPDWKWRVQANQEGTYRIILDVKSMKVQFIKIN